jgi:hypothetical protein
MVERFQFGSVCFFQSTLYINVTELLITVFHNCYEVTNGDISHEYSAPHDLDTTHELDLLSQRGHPVCSMRGFFALHG